MNGKAGKRIGIAAALILLGMVVLLFLFPEFPLRFLGKDSGMQKIEKSAEKGTQMARLTLTDKEKIFDGHGIFDPLKGVEAVDSDGSDIIGKVAVTYVSGRTISRKKIRYVLYDSNGERMEAVCDLRLENYEGPSVTLENLKSVTWEELQKLPEALIEKEQMTADDGFGGDASESVICSFKLLDRGSAEVQFSLNNLFGDYYVKKVVVPVEDIPIDVWNDAV